MVWSLYRPLLSEQDEREKNLEDITETPETKPTTTHPRLIRNLCIIFVLYLTLTIFILIWTNRNSDRHFAADRMHSSSQGQPCSCGTSVAEAISNGCKFDPYSMTWLPDHCWDGELFHLFETLKIQQNHDFSLYSFTNPPRPLTVDQVSLLAGDPWNITKNRIKTSESWHYAHCLYVLLKHFRHDVTGIDIAARYLSQEHAEHCAKTLMGLVADNPAARNISSVSAVYIFND